MTEASDGKRDFFVSFTQANRPWATWIAWVLEEKGYSVFFQDWDFRGSFPEYMDRAHREAHRTLIVLSGNYLGSEFARSEAWARYAQDAVGPEDRLVPVKVGPVSQEGILRQFVYADLTGCGEEEAQRRLLDRVKKAVEPDYRAKPSTRPDFPGGAKRKVAEKPSFPGVIHNLPPFNPDFVGREPVLAELHRRLTSGQGPAVLSQAINGLGGVGKTQTALAYCYRHLADYTLVWWLRAGTLAALTADYRALAEPLGLDPAAADQERLIARIRAALQASASWLLVFDNVEEPELPCAFLPTTGQGHALITSRRTDWQGLARVLPLEVMEESESLQLLTGRPDPDTLPVAERAEAAALAKELGYLPLALAQARGYMAGTGKSLACYRTLFEASRPAVLEKGRASPDYPTSVAKTWQISIEAAEGECAAARPLLELLAFFAPDPLPMEVLAGAPAALPEGLGDELERDEAIAALHRFSLIRAEAGTLTVHRLVQAVTRHGLGEATAKVCAEAAVRLAAKAIPFDADDPSEWPKVEALLPHALVVSAEAERFEVGLAAAGTVLNQIAPYHRARAGYAEAEPLFKRSLNIREKVLGPEHPDLAQSLNNLALLYRDTGRYTAAEPLLKRALAIREKVLGPEHPDLAQSLNNLALLYWSIGRYAEAEPLYQRSLNIREKVLGTEHPDVAQSLNNLALLYRATGRLAEAESLLKCALAIREKILGPEHPDVAQSLSNLASLYRATGRYAEAEPLLKRAIAIGEKILGPEHPNLAIRLNNLALLYQDTGRLAEAEPLYQRAIAIREKILGFEHPNLAFSLNDLATLYRNTGRYAEAEPLYKHAIAILEKTLPSDHPHRVRVRENYAGLLDQLSRPAEAAELRAQAQAIR